MKKTILTSCVLAFALLSACTQWQPQVYLSNERIADLQGDSCLSKGVSAAYAAVFNHRIVMAGGANFPHEPAAEGGRKAMYRTISMLSADGKTWQNVGELPQNLAYGVSVPKLGGYLWLGGVSDSGAVASAYFVSMPEKSENISVTPFTDLPVAMDNFAGTSIGETVFVGAGNQNGKPGNQFFALAADGKSWRKLADIPAPFRVQPVMVAVANEGDTLVYLLGGFAPGTPSTPPQMADDVLRYSFRTDAWTTVSKLQGDGENSLFSLTGASVALVDNRYIACFGGVNRTVFLTAVSDMHAIDNDTTLPIDARADKKRIYSQNYLYQPISFYRFNQKVYVFDTKTSKWSIAGEYPEMARAGATLVTDGGKIYLLNGEVKPGIRTPESQVVEVKR